MFCKTGSFDVTGNFSPCNNVWLFFYFDCLPSKPVLKPMKSVVLKWFLPFVYVLIPSLWCSWRSCCSTGDTSAVKVFYNCKLQYLGEENMKSLSENDMYIIWLQVKQKITNFWRMFLPLSTKVSENILWCKITELLHLLRFF